VRDARVEGSPGPSVEITKLRLERERDPERDSCRLVAARSAVASEHVAELEAELARVRSERAAEADTMAEMLVRVAALEARLAASAKSGAQDTEALIADLRDQVRTAEDRGWIHEHAARAAADGASELARRVAEETAARKNAEQRVSHVLQQGDETTGTLQTKLAEIEAALDQAKTCIEVLEEEATLLNTKVLDLEKALEDTVAVADAAEETATLVTRELTEVEAALAKSRAHAESLERTLVQATEHAKNVDEAHAEELAVRQAELAARIADLEIALLRERETSAAAQNEAVRIEIEKEDLRDDLLAIRERQQSQWSEHLDALRETVAAIQRSLNDLALASNPVIGVPPNDVL
jgi:chromosome segregation ATPase